MKTYKQRFSKLDGLQERQFRAWDAMINGNSEAMNIEREDTESLIENRFGKYARGKELTYLQNEDNKELDFD